MSDDDATRMDRRQFVASISALAAGCAMRPNDSLSTPAQPLFRISLAEWSLHRAIQSGALDHLDFPLTARREYAIDGVEYVSTLFKAHDESYVRELKRRAGDAGATSLLIMCDGEGRLGDPDSALRSRAVSNHFKWLDAAALLGCHSIRVNAESEGTSEEQQVLVAAGLRALCEAADVRNLNVLIENHGGLSSDARWLTGVIRLAGHPRAGTLPDFGNFAPSDIAPAAPDRYEGVRQMMPSAKAVSAKSHAFDAAGNETATDFRRMLDIVVNSGYCAWVGVEYEGEGLSEPEGIRATRALLERVRDDLQARRGRS